ncbi:MAG TPA: 50S ribosomal protein L1 [Candidatus Omnitrophica bacterium]|nr:MAG: 50S ribosomal protein L1 [Omnitrophica WOR_2 bacterium GWA2_63_20]OGX31095.1 MAG: 50S ribosomal protein L1 [Omnitrophica WOR_2 bacterium RIFCSPHIGHO2_12_FULL_64_13]OGX34985.1 MAG: 50S ribosomal protein L1 [Omnitrophica WOR_2 bacterium RIFCSPHIGHO2_02_FULL_63_39]OGX45004.1 MAG: 50S ribosomal protein L1 [Omnitrophica WOR_2 bacterium RIFCSPLOWO2_02_FULL_63_16]OGX47870.1 MAG: 50S ribosomal protein L1 [Omnitrophica WOR_2 bacterium RIFCSPLOWO2_12_FULL_63_16]HAM41935.1 50S ribosomal protein L
MSKRYEQAATLVDRKKVYALDEAMALLKEFPAAKFDETVELSVSLAIDPKKTDQLIRGTVVLPHGTGQTKRVLVFCKGEKESMAREAGADHVGFADLIDKIQGGWLEFDVAIATPDLMREVSKLGKILGPRGLMPNPRVGTVTDDVANAVTEVKRGKVEFKMDKLANVHVVLGKRSFEASQLVENTRVLLTAIVQAKPAAAKGQFIRRASVSSTMSPGVAIDVQPFLEAVDEDAD